MNSVDVEKINEEIKLLKQKLEHIDKLERLIENGATGYELAYECEEYKQEIKKISTITTEVFLGICINIKVNWFIKIGSNKVSEYNKDKYLMRIKEARSRDKKKTMSRIGYLEFKKQKPEPKEIRAKIDYKKDLDDFIDFLDDKFKEWEKTKSGKKD